MTIALVKFAKEGKEYLILWIIRYGKTVSFFVGWFGRSLYSIYISKSPWQLTFILASRHLLDACICFNIRSVAVNDCQFSFVLFCMN